MTSPQPFRQTLTSFVIRPLVCRTRRSRDAAQRSGLCESAFAAFTGTHFVTLLLFDHASLTNPEYTTLPKITDRSHATVTRIQINIVKRSLLTSSGDVE